MPWSQHGEPTASYGQVYNRDRDSGLFKSQKLLEDIAVSPRGLRMGLCFGECSLSLAFNTFRIFQNLSDTQLPRHT